LLDGIGDLHLHFVGGRAWPHRRDVDHLHREVRILRPAELLIGEEPGGAERDDQEQHQRRMAHRPGGKIEAFHRTLQIETSRSVIASQRVRAKRGPMTGSAKQSISLRKSLDCFVASLLAMTTLMTAIRTTTTTPPAPSGRDRAFARRAPRPWRPHRRRR